MRGCEVDLRAPFTGDGSVGFLAGGDGVYRRWTSSYTNLVDITQPKSVTSQNSFHTCGHEQTNVQTHIAQLHTKELPQARWEVEERMSVKETQQLDCMFMCKYVCNPNFSHVCSLSESLYKLPFFLFISLSSDLLPLRQSSHLYCCQP